jgi:hypothetical protein
MLGFPAKPWLRAWSMWPGARKRQPAGIGGYTHRPSTEVKIRHPAGGQEVAGTGGNPGNFHCLRCADILEERQGRRIL